jgi:hypothetical protein
MDRIQLLYKLTCHLFRMNQVGISKDNKYTSGSEQQEYARLLEITFVAESDIKPEV